MRLTFVGKSLPSTCKCLLLLVPVCWALTSGSQDICADENLHLADPFALSTSAGLVPMLTTDPIPERPTNASVIESSGFSLLSTAVDPLDLMKTDRGESRLSGLYLFHAYSSWRGVSEGTGANNNGLLYGANYGMPLGDFGEVKGIGLQMGAAYGLYDFSGRASGFADDELQQQMFITTGLFRKADEFTNLGAGLVLDIMLNKNFGQFAASPLLTQIRGQVAYRLNDKHEVGIWAAMRATGDTVNVEGPLSFRGVDQLNFFWHHKFDWGADGWTSFGIPDQSRLNGQGSLGSYMFGANLLMPLSPRWAAYADLQYMAPSARPGAAAASEESFYIGFGVVFYPGANSLSKTVILKSWLPWLPVANNGSFIVDTNRTF